MFKVFCQRCHQYIKDVTKSEMADMRETVICTECASHVTNSKKDIDKKRTQAIHKINLKADKALADIEEIMRGVVNGGD